MFLEFSNKHLFNVIYMLQWKIHVVVFLLCIFETTVFTVYICVNSFFKQVCAAIYTETKL